MVYNISMDVKEAYIHVIVKGISSLPDNIDLQKKVMKKCMEKGITKVFVDIRELKEPTTITEIYQFGKETASNLRNTHFKVAVLHDEDRSDHESFLETTMKNRGVNLNTFLDENEAIEWLINK